MSGITLVRKDCADSASIQYLVQGILEPIFRQSLCGKAMVNLQRVTKHLKHARSNQIRRWRRPQFRLLLKLSNYALCPCELAFAQARQCLRQ